MSRLSSFKRFSVLVALSVPMAFATGIIGASTAAHAGGEAACIGVPGGVESAPCDGRTSDTVQINVCVGGDAAGPDSGPGTYTDPTTVIGVVSGPVDVWGNLLDGPQGQAEVDGVGIGSAQTGC